eukprot:scaffold24369_cov216-Skeletonema_marinoi.AAC.5
MSNYAENLINERLGDFRFQPRAGSLNMKAISNGGPLISQIIRRGDHVALQMLLNNSNIIDADVSGEDFDFHSSDFLVKLFQICQLSLEFSHTKSSMLEEELNEANRYLKITEKNLRKQDELVATLRDELYHCKEALKKAEEQQSPIVTRIDNSMFPSQERRVNSSSSEFSGDDDDDDDDDVSDDATEIKLHIVSSSHGLHIPLIVDETCTIQTLQNKILGGKAEGCSIDFEQWSLYYKDQEVQSTGTLKEYQIINDSALVILPTSSTNKLDDIKAMLNQVVIQAAYQEVNTELLVKGMNSCNEMLEEVLQTETAERINGTVTSPSDTKSPSSEADECFDNVEQGEKMELKIDTTECNDADGDEWPFGLNFDPLPSEINVTKTTSDGGSPSNETNGKATETTGSSNSPRKVGSCDCLGDEVCDECVHVSSPRSLEAVATCNTKNNYQGEEHFTFSAFDNIEADNFTTADYDYSCDKSDFESLHIGAKEPNVVTDSDLQSIEMSLEEFALGLGANEDKKKKKSLLKKMAFKPKWKKLMCKKKAKPMDY